ncbi:hypothetical protein OG365_24595 [Streptomyces sp. NBC_00853]|uniref:hypothetical protein n=1 Tax=Streptomyces sp. NBC_00853 TaxID=2903681 RepID=UPI003872EB42|nr:hypothetical protein OG365_24595 [Streptomyces sp. NBC_00853]
MKRHEPASIPTHEHHLGAMALLLFVHQPNEHHLKAALGNVEKALDRSWRHRPDDLAHLPLPHYRDLLRYFAAPQLLDLALQLDGSDAVQRLADEARSRLATLLALYPPRPIWWVTFRTDGNTIRPTAVERPPVGEAAHDGRLRQIEDAGLSVAVINAPTEEDALREMTRMWDQIVAHQSPATRPHGHQ